MKFYYVYIVECSDGTYYTGFTSNPDKRMAEHNQGYDRNAYTFKRRPVILKWMEQFTDPNQAIAIEKQIKGWSRAKKQALIDEEWENLVKLSLNRYNRERNREGEENK